MINLTVLGYTFLLFACIFLYMFWIGFLAKKEIYDGWNEWFCFCIGEGLIFIPIFYGIYCLGLELSSRGDVV